MKRFQQFEFTLTARRHLTQSFTIVAASTALVLSGIGGLQLGNNRLSAQEREGGRSAEAEAGPRRSAEGEAGPRRSAEGERGARRPAEGNRGNAASPLRGFRPQTQREAALYQLLLQLQKEVAELRREIHGSRGTGEGGRGGERGRSDGETAALEAGWEKTKAGGVFRTYDKNKDNSVSLEEWLAITNGNVSAARRKVQTERFQEAGAGRDNALSPAEFVRWWNNREGAPRGNRGRETGKRRSAEGAAGPRRSAEGEAGARRPAESEGQRRSPESEQKPRRKSEIKF